MAGSPDKKPLTKRLVIGMSGASGAAYGIRLLEACRELGIESHLVMTGPAEMTIGYETSLNPKAVAAKDHTEPRGKPQLIEQQTGK